MKRIRWSRSARHGLTRIDDYLAGIDAGLTNDFGQTVFATTAFLLENPHAGMIVDLEARKWRIHQSRYLLFHRVVPDGIEIRRVRHDRENWRTV